jgi:hypothetical protein
MKFSGLLASSQRHIGDARSPAKPLSVEMARYRMQIMEGWLLPLTYTVVIYFGYN